MVFSPEGVVESPLWRDRALARSLEAARARSDVRLQRLFDVARQIIMSSPESDFTVGEVATGSGISLKTFYRWFASKDELLLALLEEECRLGAVMLQHAVEPHRTPATRLKRCAEAVFELAETAPDYARFIYRQHQRLKIDHRLEVSRALAPMVQVVEREVRNAAEAGVADPGDPRSAAELVFSLLIDALASFSSSARADPETVSSTWRFIAGGLDLRRAAVSSQKE